MNAPILFSRRLHFPNTFAFLICWVNSKVFVIHSHLHSLHLSFSFLSIFRFSSIFVLVPLLLAGTTTISYLRSSPDLHFYTMFLVEEHTKTAIFNTKIMIFISNSMTTISYLHSSSGLHFYTVFLVEKHTKDVISISKLYEYKFVFFVTSHNTKI